MLEKAGWRHGVEKVDLVSHNDTKPDADPCYCSPDDHRGSQSSGPLQFKSTIIRHHASSWRSFEMMGYWQP